VFFVTMAGADPGCQPPDVALALKFERSFNVSWRRRNAKRAPPGGGARPSFAL